nr:DNA-directed DNA polymerase [Tanacetum cinerariifolium]
ELKDLPPHLEYAFLEGDNKLPVIISKEFGEVEKLLDAGLIYPIFDSPWVSPVHCVPKKGCFTVVENEENELIPTRLVTGWRVYTNYRKLNKATRKDHFPLPFTDQMLERLAGNEYYCFLDGFSGYFQIPIDPRDQEKTTLTCPYVMFSYRRMPFGLRNAPGTFQRCEDTNLCLNGEKSHFMVKEGIILGHKISKNRIEVDRAKVDVIAKLPHPTTVKGAVLGQHHEKHFRPIHYASKMMNDVESNYTMTEKEMLAVVYAFEKFRSYLIMNKSIVHTDHSALKYLFAKKDAKAGLLCERSSCQARLWRGCTTIGSPESPDFPHGPMNAGIESRLRLGDKKQVASWVDCPDCEVSRALGFSFTRASHLQLHFGNPVSKSLRLTFSFGLPNKWPLFT